VTTSAVGPREKHRSDVAAVLALSLLGLGLRFMVTRSIWLDEAISIAQAQLPFRDMLAGLAAYDVHPPLHHAVLWYSVRLLGTGELAVRIPSIIAGTLLIPMLYGAGRDLYDRRVGLVAAALGSIAPIAIWYSQEARMYAIFMLFSLIAIWAQVRVLRRTGRLGAWAVYSIATAAMIWTQYFAVLQVLVQQAAFAGAYWQRRRTGEHRRLRRAWIASTVTLLFLLAPLWPVLESQVHAYADRSGGQVLPAQAGLGAARPDDQLSIYAFIAAAVWSVWGYHADATMAQIVALWPLGMLALLVLLGRGYSPLTTLLISVAAVPALMLFVAGLAQRNLFEPRYFAGAVSAGMLLIARLASSAANRGARTAVVGLLIATLLVGLADQQLNGANPRLYDFRGALNLVTANARPGDVVVYEPDYIGPVVNYYAAQLDAKPLDAGLSSSHGRRRRVFLIGSFLQEPRSASQVGNAIEQLSERRRRVEEYQRPNVRVWVFQ
jgi:4-amino-4-deoxy-L-arabinose transferase-like glycosyltransferase